MWETASARFSKLLWTRSLRPQERQRPQPWRRPACLRKTVVASPVEGPDFRAEGRGVRRDHLDGDRPAASLCRAGRLRLLPSRSRSRPRSRSAPRSRSGVMRSGRRRGDAARPGAASRGRGAAGCGAGRGRTPIGANLLATLDPPGARPSRSTRRFAAVGDVAVPRARRRSRTSG